MSLTPMQFAVAMLCPVPATIEQRHRAMMRIFEIIAVVPSEALQQAYLAELADCLSQVPIKR